MVRFVEGFTHQFIYTLSPAEIQDAIKRTGHALGEVEKEEAITSIQDFTCPFALHHIFHELIETQRIVPRWEDFNAFVKRDVRGKWYEPLRNASGALPEIKAMIAALGKQEAWDRAKRAIQWRLGNFYLSAMRELDLFVRLRHMGVPLRYHVLADVLLRVDFWTPDTLLCVYFENRRYRDRKHSTEDFFTGIPIVHTRFERQGFGKIWLADKLAVNELRDELLTTRAGDTL